MKEAHYGNNAQYQNEPALMATSKTDFLAMSRPNNRKYKLFNPIKEKHFKKEKKKHDIGYRFTGMLLKNLMHLYPPTNTRWNLDERKKGGAKQLMGRERFPAYNTKSSILHCKILRTRILHSQKLYVCFNVSLES